MSQSRYDWNAIADDWQSGEYATQAELAKKHSVDPKYMKRQLVKMDKFDREKFERKVADRARQMIAAADLPSGTPATDEAMEDAMVEARAEEAIKIYKTQQGRLRWLGEQYRRLMAAFEGQAERFYRLIKEKDGRYDPDAPLQDRMREQQSVIRALGEIAAAKERIAAGLARLARDEGELWRLDLLERQTSKLLIVLDGTGMEDGFGEE